MILITILVFILAALLGLTLLIYVLKNKNTPKGVAIIHGTVAASGIILLIIYSFTNASKPYLPLIIFILAALGGFYMMYRDITNKTLPKWLAVGHGVIALIAFLLLLAFAMNY